MYTKNKVENRLSIIQLNVAYEHVTYKPNFRKSSYVEDVLNGSVEAYINLDEAPISVGGKLL